jgi:hypothetical protein
VVDTDAPAGEFVPIGDDDRAGAQRERQVIEDKLQNTRKLEYPAGSSKCSSSPTAAPTARPSCIRDYLDDRTRLIELPERGGKAAALNAGLSEARRAT